MLKERDALIRSIHIVIDLCSIVGALFLAYRLLLPGGGPVGVYHYLWVLLVMAPVWLILLHYFGFFGSKRMSGILRILLDLGKVHVAGAIITSSVIFLLDPPDFSRSPFVLTILLSYLVLGSIQLATRVSLQFIRRRGYNYRNIILVGTEQGAQHLVKLVEARHDWGFCIVGLVQPQDGPHPERKFGYPLLGTLNGLVEICKKYPVDEVIFCTSKEEFKFHVESYVHDLEEMGITVRMVLNLYYKFNIRKDIGLFHSEVPVITFYPTTFDAGQLFLKRCLDIFGACVGLAITAILLPFFALAIKLDSPGPLFFSQTRVRENGRTFSCWKFRTMYIDAEERKKELMQLNEMKGAFFKIKNDPRVTRVGRFLRKTSLDELPQFWNVLCGEMSLVGTRPPTPDEVEKYENWQRKRICIKPGITGLWQVSGRNQISDFDEVVRLDLDYIERWSLSLDLYLLAKTFKVVFAREGSC